MKEDKQVYVVRVCTSNGSKDYLTFDENVFCNFDYGNASTIRFVTTNGVNVSIPPSVVVIEQSIKEQGE
ncbi:MAG: hypothetical protein OEL89_00720 [Candidatus Peregrinibacteria bacterium]|nr:hypothetical protein [Candidatus Peregrinibacteria bacterium]